MKRRTFHKNTILYFIISIALSIFMAGGSDCIAAISSYHTSPASPESSNPSTVPQNGIFELTLADQVNYGAQANFFEVSISVTFTSPSPSSVTTTVHGFYYDTLRGGTSLWKARFSPSQTGTYTYTYVFTHTQSGDQSGSGSFLVIPGSNPGFIRQNPSNKYRWEFSNGEPFYPYGFNGVGGFNDIQLTDGGDRNGAFIDGSARAITNDEHLGIFSNAGFNMIRFSQDNGNTPLLTGEKDKYDVYDKDAAIYHDWYLQKLRSNNFRIFYGLFGFEYNMENPPSSDRLAFVRYAVDRWAAYVDVWEILNESNPPNDSWLVTIANEIRARDPYNHPITTSHSFPPQDAPGIEITSPHIYAHEDELTSDQYVVNNFASIYKGWNKPIILGEQGNTEMNWLRDSALRMRLRGWTAFFKELSILFWETSYATNGVAGTIYTITNIYLGHEERQYAHIMMWFVNQVLKPSSVEAPVAVSDSTLMRAYGLKSSDGFAAYIHHYADHTNIVSGETITIDIPQTGKGYWIDPKTGKNLLTIDVSSGNNIILTIPNFIVDIAFFSTASPLGDTEPIAHVVIDNPDKDLDLDGDGKEDYGPTVMPFGMPGLMLSFDASGSYDLDGDAVTCLWDYGDGTTGSGASVSHTYPDGVHLTTLSVTDNEGNVAKHSFLVRATADPNPNKNDPPAFKFPSNSISVREGEPVYITVLANDMELESSSYVGDTLTFSASNLPEGAIFGQWKAGWGNQLYWVPDVDQAGSYQVQFNVQDDSGASVQRTITINVSNVFNSTSTYTITSSAGVGGTILPSGSVPVSSGANQTFAINASTGYSIAEVLVDGTNVGAVTSHTFYNVTANHSITASFVAVPTYTITASAGTGGTITPSGSVTVNQGANQTFTITAALGYSIAEVLVDGTNVGAVTSHTFYNVTANHTITVSFVAIPTYTITASAGPGGTITPSGTVVVSQGASRTFTIAAGTGYSIADVLVDGTSVGTPTSHTFTNVTDNHTITASFAIKTYTLTVLATNGSITKNPDRESYNHGDDVTLQAIPITKYYFTNWSGALSGSANPATIDMDSDKTITANFAYDGTDPSTYGHMPTKYPALHSDQAARDTIIQLHIADSGSGVKNVRIHIESDLIYDGDVVEYSTENAQQAVRGVCRRVGTALDYTFVFQPSTLFDYEQKVDVVVNATDKAGNIMPVETYYFYTVMRTFGKNVKVNSDTGTLIQNHPATARDSVGNIWIVWDQTTAAGDTDIYIGKLPVNGSAFESSQLVFGGLNDQRNPAIAIHGNALYVVWEESAGSNWDILLLTSTDGITWRYDSKIEPFTVNVNLDPDDPDPITLNPAITIDSLGKIYVTWEEQRSGNKDIWVRSREDGVWGTATQITNEPSNQTEPAITIDTSNTAYIVWTDARVTGRTDIYGAASNNSWTDVAIINNTKNQTSPVVAAESTGSTLHFLWVDDTPVDNDIYYASSNNGLPGSALSGSSIVNEANTTQIIPSIAVDGTKVFACWEDWRHVVNNNEDTDIYFSESNLYFTDSDDRTNIHVNDDIGTYTQTAPVIGTDKYGNPYMVWVDNRLGNNDIYYAGAMSVGPALKTADVTANSGGTVAVNSSLQVYIPAGALSTDTTITIAEMVNPPEVPSDAFGVFYEFSPGGLQFNPLSPPVTITLPHTISECPGYSTYRIYWYNAEIGAWSQTGITNVRHVVLSSTLHAVKFETTHFTGFGVGGSVGSVVSVGGGGGGGGGGCAISANGRVNVIEYMLPYVFYVVVLLLIKLKDARNRKAI